MTSDTDRQNPSLDVALAKRQYAGKCDSKGANDHCCCYDFTGPPPLTKAQLNGLLRGSCDAIVGNGIVCGIGCLGGACPAERNQVCGGVCYSFLPK
ncbi:hypothetical protein M427DRAFT_51473 [Gonapodya prolifera JEL478]|uniref:Uncharacterized protein n=1 Tax=Gonapodya prolifera (strain JEL478) TaxID=1344416 RepID=A0A139AWV7_GONPJ|nr:hypothetical protein M427DRAFT_51473 [Gonapodya prolifera JEL478]|eukprot:KXS21210.1 hypothetical protein M427DRAFT_51473 [Gonapodya prolifera JEL478]